MQSGPCGARSRRRSPPRRCIESKALVFGALLALLAGGCSSRKFLVRLPNAQQGFVQPRSQVLTPCKATASAVSEAGDPEAAMGGSNASCILFVEDCPQGIAVVRAVVYSKRRVEVGYTCAIEPAVEPEEGGI